VETMPVAITTENEPAGRVRIEAPNRSMPLVWLRSAPMVC
jgi:hypothetical protein